MEVYSGETNTLTITRKYGTVYKCNFNLALYPFDVQQCEMELRITSELKSFLAFDVANSSVQYLSNPFLIEYEVGWRMSGCLLAWLVGWFVNSNVLVSVFPASLLLQVGTVLMVHDNSGRYSEARVVVPLARRYGYAILTIYTPTLVLLVVSYTTLFFRTSIFDTRMMAALTVQLVIATLFSQVRAGQVKH